MAKSVSSSSPNCHGRLICGDVGGAGRDRASERASEREPGGARETQRKRERERERVRERERERTKSRGTGCARSADVKTNTDTHLFRQYDEPGQNQVIL